MTPSSPKRLSDDIQTRTNESHRNAQFGWARVP